MVIAADGRDDVAFGPVPGAGVGDETQVVALRRLGDEETGSAALVAGEHLDFPESGGIGVDPDDRLPAVAVGNPVPEFGIGGVIDFVIAACDGFAHVVREVGDHALERFIVVGRQSCAGDGLHFHLARGDILGGAVGMEDDVQQVGDRSFQPRIGLRFRFRFRLRLGLSELRDNDRRQCFSPGLCIQRGASDLVGRIGVGPYRDDGLSFLTGSGAGVEPVHNLRQLPVAVGREGKGLCTLLSGEGEGRGVALDSVGLFRCRLLRGFFRTGGQCEEHGKRGRDFETGVHGVCGYPGQMYGILLSNPIPGVLYRQDPLSQRVLSVS